LSELIERAAAFARQAHAHQRRKYTNEPYEIHLGAVAGLVRSVGAEPEAQAAAWLHDVVEDTEVTLEEVRREFGEHVARLVDELTDVSRREDGNRAARKTVDREHLARASVEAQTVKLADLIDNARSITEHDPRFAKVFLAEMAELLDVLVAGDEQLRDFARDTLEDCLREVQRPGGD
jgi:(p)ppGpp synthase/HD superfamily hydrolase